MSTIKANKKGPRSGHTKGGKPKRNPKRVPRPKGVRGGDRGPDNAPRTRRTRAKVASDAAVTVSKLATGQIGPRKHGELIRAFYSSLPQEQWDRVLAVQPTTSAGGKLLAIMHDASFATWSLERQCAEAGITDFRELVRMVSDHSLGSALINSTRHTEEIVESIAEDSKTRLATCDLCLDLRDEDGLPTYITVAHPRDASQMLQVECPKCGGVGKVRRTGDARARETFLKLHGGLEETGQPLVQLNQQFNYGSQHAEGVHRGQQLLARGRSMAKTAPNSPNTAENTSESRPRPSESTIDVTATPQPASEGAK